MILPSNMFLLCDPPARAVVHYSWVSVFTFLRLEDFKERRGDIAGLSRNGPVMDRVRSLSSLNEASAVNLSNGNQLMGD